MSSTTHDPITEYANGVEVDPRVKEKVPKFDAPFFQAGLAGYSDGAMRLVAREHGCPFCVTEALLDTTLINGGKGRRRENPDILEQESQTTDNTLRDHPIAGQIIGTTPREMAEGATILVSMGYDTIDVNLACPVKKIRRRNRGGHFLGAPNEAIEILAAVREVVPFSIPTTMKLRRGFDDSEESRANFYAIFDSAFDLNYAWSTVHARSVKQKYEGPSRWSFLKELVQSRPEAIIFGSGDIWCAEDIFRMMQQTGVHGASVARGCIGNPWVFTQARALMKGEEPRDPTISEQRSAMLRHFELCTNLHGEQAASRMMRKFGIRFSQYHSNPKTVRKHFISVRSAKQWRDVLDTYYCVS